MAIVINRLEGLSVQTGIGVGVRVMKKNWLLFLEWIQKNIVYLLPIVTVGLIILLIFSFVVPKKVIDTYKTNTTEEENDKEYLIPLTETDTISYHMNTGTRPMMGIHIGLAKNGNTFTNGTIICNIYADESKENESEHIAYSNPISVNSYSLNQGEDVQYIYIPFQNYEQVKGDICIVFNFRPDGEPKEAYLGILANGREIKDAFTQVNEKRISGNIKTMYIYTHNTYPLVYDLRILVVLFIAACMTLSYHKSRRFVHEK